MQAARHDAEVAREIRARFEQLVQRSPMPRAIESRLGRTPVFGALQQTPATAVRQRSAVPGGHLLDIAQHIWTQGEHLTAGVSHVLAVMHAARHVAACSLLQTECTG